MYVSLKGNNPKQDLFDNIGFLIRGGGTPNQILARRRVESITMKLTFYVKSHLFLILHIFFMDHIMKSEQFPSLPWLAWGAVFFLFIFRPIWTFFLDIFAPICNYMDLF